ncbi:MAG: FtsW/RodA/SpoVE family cell cycle protein [Bacteroidales bacterium]|nr:FtsW/RodA/SpoVE family cell cycle protein [Bacteroidales bacterium]
MKKYSFVIVSLILGILFLKLSHNYSDRFSDIKKSYGDNTSINLVKDVDVKKISTVLFDNNYMQDKQDADFLAEQLAGKLKSGQVLSELSDLNKRAWQLPCTVIDTCKSAELRKKLYQSQVALGLDEEFKGIAVGELESYARLNEKHDGKIEVYVNAEDDKANINTEDDKANFLKKITKKDKKCCVGTVVRLSMHDLDSLSGSPERRTICYLKTDGNGKAIFEGLDPALSYSVLPIRKGYEYGVSKGTLSGSLSRSSKNNSLSFSFTEMEHRIRLFDTATLRQIKEDKAMTVRSPEKFKSILTISLAMFFIAWWGLYLSGIFRRRRLDAGIMSSIMLLTGICLMTMFSINDPLTDRLLGIEMAQGIVFGIIAVSLLCNVDFIGFYQNRLPVGFDIPLECMKWIFRPFREKVAYLTEILTRKTANGFYKLFAVLVILVCTPFLVLDLFRMTRLNGFVDRLCSRLPKGTGYLLIAIFLTVSLFLFGNEVGGMKVNLNLLGLKFQPSEIAKYLVVIFMAAFFTANADSIVKYSEKGNAGLFGAKLKMLAAMIVGLGMMMLLYLALGDMGPALILAFTFIILYSIVKSKVDIEGLDDSRQLVRLLTCDLAMLLYGAISFIACLYVGNLAGSMGAFCIGWFAVWIIFGICRKQIFESAIMFNLIIAAFLFAGNILGHIPQLESTAERLESRNEMCSNTWGILPVDGNTADAGENTQVAEGLWGLASGGLSGQGLGNGAPYYIPAYHTDMILESIGEQMGFIGISMILLALAVLLRRTMLAGYRTSHPFPFYLCTGIAIVTAVQFIVISLGSLGIIPLTGVTVPFLSYGRVSMILNLAAFGIILSISRDDRRLSVNENKVITDLIRRNIGQYNYSVSILSWMYCILAVLICGTFFYWQFIARDRTLIRPVYVNNSSGVPVIEYNPRISQLTRKMYAGDIYDRNGVLLATSDRSRLAKDKKTYSGQGLECDTLKRQRRYYPFGEHLYFMLGDYNSMLFFSSSDKSPRGYMAEARHLSELRGYDNILRDSEGKPVRVDLSSNSYRPEKYFSSDYEFFQKGVQLRDHSALIPYLKAGVNSDKVRRLNGRNTRLLERETVKPQDIQLTIDACLQTKLQQNMKAHMSKKDYSGMEWNKVRASVVVLDARNGDLLASANYPLPDYDVLKTSPDVYSDYRKGADWKAYTDMDLGLVYPTAPGSTAKVMSSLAAFRKDERLASKKKYYIYEEEKIYGNEPSGRYLDMKDALRYSSNCYFINLVNDMSLYDELAYIYGNAGVNVNGAAPYIFEYSLPSEDWNRRVTSQQGPCVSAYEKYIKSGVKEKMNDKKPAAWSWAWGQNGVDATPAAMARIVSVAANCGKMPKTRYLLQDEKDDVDYVDRVSAELLNEYLKFTAQNHDKFTSAKGFHGDRVGGKTGTSERYFDRSENNKRNDGWYICFIENAKISKVIGQKTELDDSPLAVAVRMERLPGKNGSGRARQLTKEVVWTSLDTLGYINKL